MTTELLNFPASDAIASKTNTNNHEEQDEENGSLSRKRLYKYRGFSLNQEERRKRLLETQKKKREESFNKCRQLKELSAEDEEMDVSESAKQNKVRVRKFANMLMMSEWMTEVPADLESQWLFVPCPVGKRCLVVAHGCVTRAFSSSGKPLARFESLLPGGSSACAAGQTVLDCVWSWRESTYYVLDVLVWKNQPFINCEAVFRFYWIQNNLAEIEGISEIQKKNKFKFTSLPNHTCSSTELSLIMNGLPPFPNVMDGVLFYHREAHYDAGASPLVVWLLPFMLPEVLGVSVSEVLSAQCPADYPGHLEFVQRFQEQNRKERRDDYRQRKAASRAVMQGEKLDTSMDAQGSEPDAEDYIEENCDLELG